MAVSMTVAQYLFDEHIPYETLVHKACATAMTCADSARVSGDQLAKGVLCRDSDGYILAVIPASHLLELDALGDQLGAPVELAGERDMPTVFPDCIPGAVPATGQPYGLRVVWDDALTMRDEVFFEGGDHETLVEVHGDALDRMTRGCDHGRISHHL